MSRFWLSICVALVIAFAIAHAIPSFGGSPPSQRTYDHRPPVAVQVAHFAFLGSLVAIVWAICFRPQLEKLQISLFALFALVAMEALLLLAARLLDPH
ncbi:MAG: hypothetical protein HY000_23465 [Planctomycetes bacterium]|nr:hypothetical protein [Planctomycetota bacterium]